jgi:O-antigen ligase
LRLREIVTLAIGASLLVVGIAALADQASPVRLLRRDYLSLENRLPVWQVQWETFVQSPLIGHGLAGGTHAVNDLSDAYRGRAGGEGSYGDLLTVAGVLGAVPLFFGLFSAARTLRRLAKRRTAPVFLQEAFALLLLLLVVSVSESWLATLGTMSALYAWAVCGAVSGGSGRLGRNRFLQRAGAAV